MPAGTDVGKTVLQNRLQSKYCHAIGDRVLTQNEVLLIKFYVASETLKLYIPERMKSVLNRFRFTLREQNKSLTTLTN